MNRASLCVVVLSVCLQGLPGCKQRDPQYGREARLSMPAMKTRQVWAVAPAVDLSGQRDVDPILQADLLYQQLQQVRGLTVVPVNRVAEVYASLGITRVQSEEQAAIVCDLLGCDGLVVASVTAYDPYNPPKFGGSLQLFTGGRVALTSTTAADLDPRELARRAAPAEDEPLPRAAATGFRQAVGMYDAANGSVRDALLEYAAGRNDPIGPMGAKEYLVSMDRFCGFAYHSLTAELLGGMRATTR